MKLYDLEEHRKDFHIPGFFDYSSLYDRVVERSHDGAVMVEVGVWQGCSARYLAKRAASAGLSFHLWLVDLFRGHKGTEKLMKGIHPSFGPNSNYISMVASNLRRAGIADHVSLLQCPSDLAARLFDDGACDFVFVDADHEYESVKKDILAWLPKVRPGGLLAGHDMNFPGVNRAVKEIFGTGFSQGHGVCWMVDIPG